MHAVQYFERSDFLAAMTRAIDRQVPLRRIAFSKCSPAPLDSASPFLGALARAGDRGASLDVALLDSVVDGTWLDALTTRCLSHPDTRVGIVDSRRFALTPVLVVDDRCAFLHCTWPARPDAEELYWGTEFYPSEEEDEVGVLCAKLDQHVSQALRDPGTRMVCVSSGPQAGAIRTSKRSR